MGYFATQDSFHLRSFPWAETPSHRRKIDTFFLGLCDVPPGNSGLSERWLGEGFDLFASLCVSRGLAGPEELRSPSLSESG